MLAALAAGIVLVLSVRKPVTEAPSAPPAATGAPGLPRLVDLGAGQCIPCKMMTPILGELRREQAGKLEVVFIDVWKNPDAGEKYGIRSIPTQVFCDAAGKEFLRHEGFIPKAEILAAFRKQGIPLSEANPGR
ncbi:MAG: thioredoxin family protein [Armatimonadetes bacterium]|nr:thioredoxin family protein [Armatimonadota bacterium]